MRDVKILLQDACYLLLRRIAVSRDGHFDFQRRILKNRDITFQRSSHCYALCPSQLQHTLHVLSVERSLDGKLVGMIRIDQPQDTLEDFLQPEVIVYVFSQLDDAHRLELWFVVQHQQDTVSHNDGTRVDA